MKSELASAVPRSSGAGRRTAAAIHQLGLRMKTAPALLGSIRLLTRRLPRRLSGRILRTLPEGLISQESSVKYRGLLLQVFTGENIGRRIFFFNEYEPEQERLFLERVRPGDLVFDVGANIGIYSLQAARAGARVVSFEPSREPLRLLRKNVAANRLEHAVCVIPEAVSNREGVVAFFSTTHRNWGVGRIFSFGEPSDDIHGPARYDVPCHSLNHYVRRFGMPRLLKIDIEGAELLVLRGGREVLAAPDAPDILVEFHPGEIAAIGGSLEECFGILAAAGYQRVDPSGHFDVGGGAGHQWHLFSKLEPRS